MTHGAMLLAFGSLLLCSVQCIRLDMGTTEQKKPKVMIISSVDNLKSAAKFGSDEQIIANRDCYAKRHGYEAHTTTNTSRDVEDMHDKRWLKVYLFKKFMAERKDVDWMMWVDGDAMFIDLERPLDDFIKEASDDQYLIMMSEREGCLYKSNVFLIKNNDLGRGFVDHWLSIQGSKCTHAWATHNVEFGDQCKMQQTLLELSNVTVAPTKSADAQDAEAKNAASDSEEAGEDLIYRPNVDLRFNRAGIKCNIREKNDEWRKTPFFLWAPFNSLVDDCVDFFNPGQVPADVFIVHKGRSDCVALFQQTMEKCAA